jgi:hypothetical protein
MKQQLVITINDKGEVSVSGPLENKLICYGLLEMAKDIIAAYTEQAQKQIKPATKADLSLITGERA